MVRIRLSHTYVNMTIIPGEERMLQMALCATTPVTSHATTLPCDSDSDSDCEMTDVVLATKVNFEIIKHRFSRGSMWYFIQWVHPTPNPSDEDWSWIMEHNLPKGALDVEYLNAYKEEHSIL
jgi:hypothetical protein